MADISNNTPDSSLINSKIVPLRIQQRYPRLDDCISELEIKSTED